MEKEKRYIGNVYFALGTPEWISGAEGRRGKKVFCAPWDIFAVSGLRSDLSALPPYYKVTGIADQKFVMERVEIGSQDYSRIEKWVGEYDGRKGCPIRRNLFRCHQRGDGVNGGVVDAILVATLLDENELLNNPVVDDE